jgi:polyferredoxin
VRCLRQAVRHSKCSSTYVEAMTKRNTRGLKDNSRLLRRTSQILFLLLNIWIGVQFFLFVRHFETAGSSIQISRPPGIEGWLPIASLMNLKAFLETGALPSVHPAGMFILIAFVLISWLLRKSFCGWLCPVGTVSEWFWRIGKETFKRNWVLPKWLDLTLRPLKYLLMSLFLYAVAGMSADAIQSFLAGPYGMVADVKMLNFFRFMSTSAAVTLGVFAIASIFIQNFWCRYLCPYGAFLGLFSLASPLMIRRKPETCIDCGKCARNCPSLLPVDHLVTVKSAECTACLICIDACPVEGALDLTVARRRVPAWVFTAAIAAIFIGVCGFAQWEGYWHTNLPDQVYMRLVPAASELEHP